MFKPSPMNWAGVGFPDCNRGFRYDRSATRSATTTDACCSSHARGKRLRNGLECKRRDANFWTQPGDVHQCDRAGTSCGMADDAFNESNYRSHAFKVAGGRTATVRKTVWKDSDRPQADDDLKCRVTVVDLFSQALEQQAPSNIHGTNATSGVAERVAFDGHLAEAHPRKSPGNAGQGRVAPHQRHVAARYCYRNIESGLPGIR